MKQHQILFSSAMVRAILSGRKTQTRRIVKYSPFESSDEGLENLLALGYIKCPYGKKGDRLMVRETWAQTKAGFVYKADYCDSCSSSKQIGIDKWKPSIHMPSSACRLFLEIQSIRFERLQEISEKDAIAEGIDLLEDSSGVNKYTIHVGNGHYNAPIAKEVFAMLWDAINGVESWDLNPFVWVLSFRRVNA